MKRTSSVIWNGSVKEGSGYITTQSGCLDKQPYGWGSRFEKEHGTNPEELIAASHAACYSMQLSSLLTKAGFIPDIIETKVEVSLEGGIINGSHLIVKGSVGELDQQQFEKYAQEAKESCPVSKALNMPITMETFLTEKIMM